MNILYIHGFGSRFDPTSEKILTLGKLGTVYGVNLDYTKPYECVVEQCQLAIKEHNIGLIVGTSIGGYMACHVGGGEIPFVSINPAIYPAISLEKYKGYNTDHFGKEYFMSQHTIDSYPRFAEMPNGIILIDMEDEVIDSFTSHMIMITFGYPVYTFEGGSHRFEHMEEALPIIEEFYHSRID